MANENDTPLATDFEDSARLAFEASYPRCRIGELTDDASYKRFAAILAPRFAAGWRDGNTFFTKERVEEKLRLSAAHELYGAGYGGGPLCIRLERGVPVLYVDREFAP